MVRYISADFFIDILYEHFQRVLKEYESANWKKGSSACS